MRQVINNYPPVYKFCIAYGLKATVGAAQGWRRPCSRDGYMKAFIIPFLMIAKLLAALAIVVYLPAFGIPFFILLFLISRED